MSLRKIRRPMPIHHKVEMKGFFGDGFVPEWFFDTLEIDKDLSNCHLEYYRKNVGLPFAWCPVYLVDRDPENTIFYTTVNMIDFCERLMENFNNLPPKMEGIIREIQDRFLQIALHMELKNSYTDEQLLRKDSVTDCSAFDMYRPRRGMEFTEECLPDLFVHVFHVNYWGEESVPVFDRALDIQIIDFLKKLIPNPCKSRSLTEIVSDVWLNRSTKRSKRKLTPSEIEQFFQVNVRLIFASLLGVYDHCKVKSSLTVRMKLYRYFCMDFPGKEAFSSWFNDNDELILYAMREFLLFSITHIPALQDYMENHYYWSFLSANTFDTMNSVRSRVNSNIGYGVMMHPILDRDGRSLLSQYMTEMYNSCLKMDDPSDFDFWCNGNAWYSGVNGFLQAAKSACLDYANRAMDKNFVDKLIDTVLSIDCEDENNGIYIDNPRNRNKEVFTREDSDRLEDSVFESVLFDDYNYSYDWLPATHHVSLKSIFKLREVEHLILYEKNRSSLRTVLTEIKREEPYDYAVIRCLFFAFKKKYSITFHPLPKFLLKKQLETEMKLYETAPGERICHMAGVYYICTSCGDIKAFILGNRKQKTKDLSVRKEGENWDEEKLKHDNKEENIRELSLYSRDVAMDTGTGELYCYLKRHQEFQRRKYDVAEDEWNPSRKKKAPKKDLIMDIINKKKKRKKRTRKSRKKKKKEEDDPEEEEDEIEDEEETQSEKKNNNSNQLKNRHMSSRCTSRHLKSFNALGQLITTEDTGPCFKCPYCGSFSTYERKNLRDANGHISCGCMHVNFRWKFSCELCNRTVSKKAYVRWIYDDESPTECIRPSVICKKHRLASVKRYNGILTLSKMKQMVNAVPLMYGP